VNTKTSGSGPPSEPPAKERSSGLSATAVGYGVVGYERVTVVRSTVANSWMTYGAAAAVSSREPSNDTDRSPRLLPISPGSWSVTLICVSEPSAATRNDRTFAGLSDASPTASVVPPASSSGVP
jgi:hypothetical protein